MSVTVGLPVKTGSDSKPRVACDTSKLFKRIPWRNTCIHCWKVLKIQCTPLKCIGSGLPRRYAHKRSMQIGGVQWTATLYSRPTLNISALCWSQSFENAHWHL